MATSVRLIDDPVLRTPCLPVDSAAIKLKGLDVLLLTMHETMVAEKGIGLAANQIGLSMRLFILRDTEKTYRTFINPEIVASEELVPFEGEGCLSVPGASGTTKRFRKVTLQWVDYQTGDSKQESFEDLAAFAVQHEMDHLNGILYLDQFGPVKRDMIIKKHKKFLKLRGAQNG